MSMYAHKHMNCPTCRCTDTINVNDIGEVIDPKQAEIDELVEMLKEAMEWNWLVDDVSMGHAADVSRSKGQELIEKYKGE